MSILQNGCDFLVLVIGISKNGRSHRKQKLAKFRYFTTEWTSLCTKGFSPYLKKNVIRGLVLIKFK